MVKKRKNRTATILIPDNWKSFPNLEKSVGVDSLLSPQKKGTACSRCEKRVSDPDQWCFALDFLLPPPPSFSPNSPFPLFPSSSYVFRTYVSSAKDFPCVFPAPFRAPYISLTSVSGQALIYAMLRELFALQPAYHSVTESIFLENLSLRFPFLRANEVTYSTRTRSSKDPFPSSLKSLSLSNSINPRIIFPCVKSREAGCNRGADSATGWVINEEGILIFAARWKKIKTAGGGSRFC